MGVPPQAAMYHPEGHLMTKIIYYYIQFFSSTERKNLIITNILRCRACSYSWCLSRYQRRRNTKHQILQVYNFGLSNEKTSTRTKITSSKPVVL